MTLAQQIADKALATVAAVVQTDYQHVDNIDSAAGRYDCDCNGFVAFVLQQVAPDHYALLPQEPTQTRPRAFEYYDYFATLTPDSTGDWRRIDLLVDARPGDVIAWRFPTIEADENTGHVVIVAATPEADASGIVAVRVCDSADTPHFDDSRGSGAGQWPTGVGSGLIRFVVDAAGRPIAYLFAPPDTAEYDYRPIAIGRAE